MSSHQTKNKRKVVSRLATLYSNVLFLPAILSSSLGLLVSLNPPSGVGICRFRTQTTDKYSYHMLVEQKIYLIDVVLEDNRIIQVGSSIKRSPVRTPAQAGSAMG